MSSLCLFTAYTLTGAALPLDDADRPVYAVIDPDSDNEIKVRVSRASQLRRIEQRHGRVLLEIGRPDGAGVESYYSNALNLGRTPGVDYAEKKYGKPAGEAFRAFAGRYASADAALKVAKAVATSNDPVTAMAAAALTSKLISGGANRWARGIAADLRSDPQALLDDLAVLFNSTDDPSPAGGITVRSLAEAQLVAGIVRAGRAGLDGAPFREISHDARLYADDVIAAHHRSDHPWIQSETPDGGLPQTSGYKLHIYCADAGDVRDAIRRVIGVVHDYDLLFKVASAAYAASPHDQARKGVTIYLPSRDTAAEITQAVVREMRGWIEADKVPSGDLAVGNGVGLRNELGLNLGCEVSPSAYANLYQSAMNTYPEDVRATLTESVEGVRRLYYDLVPDPVLTEAHLARLRPTEKTFEMAAVKQPEPFIRALRLAHAGIDPVDANVYHQMPGEQFEQRLAATIERGSTTFINPRPGSLSDRLISTVSN